MNILLYINDQEVELTEQVNFLLDKQFEDIKNPTSILNDCSKTVSIPFTESNNRLFGYLYKPERVIVSNGTDNVGIYFDPLKKLDFKLIWNSMILMTGYAKMNEIKQDGEKGTYEITLFGQLGKVFQEMKKITFDTATTELVYLIDGSQYVEEKINRSLVYNSWTSSGQTHELLYPKYIKLPNDIYIPHPLYSVTDIIGFAPNNSFSNDFKYDTYQESKYESDTFKNELGDSFKTATGVDPETIIPNGMLPREIGEYRSYLQLPFIYWNKLFKIFQAKAQSITGYTFNLDSSWFNTSNPYWYNLVYMLKPFDSKNGKIYNNLYAESFGQTVTYSSVLWETSNFELTSNTWTENRDFNYFKALSGSSTEVIEICDFGSPFSKWTLPEKGSTVLTFPMMIQIQDFWSSGYNPYLADDNALIISVTATGANNVTETQKFIVKKSTSSITEDNAETVIKDTELKQNIYTNFQSIFICDYDKFGSYVLFSVSMHWKNSNNPSSDAHTGTLDNRKQINIILFPQPNQLAESVTMDDKIFKSGSKFILNDLWNKEYNIFELIIKYCKMFRIFITVDDFKKEISFISYKKYFENYTLTDWTDKVDKSKPFVVKPITFENKYVLFNYKDIDSKISKNYKNRYGVNYGEYRLITDYNFNTDTANLFDNITQSVIYTDNVLSWKNLYTNHKIVFSFPAELYVYNQDDDKKQVDIFGAFYFHKGLQSFDTEAALNLVAVKISDDTPFQLSTNTFYYSRNAGYRTLVSTCPKLDIINGTDLCIFNKPMENYTYVNNYNSTNGIYDNIWYNYIQERYNVQNKIVTCYLKLSAKDWTEFEFRNFIIIDNVLYMVNRIYDWDITSNNTTKVELVTISDISGYTS